MSGTINRARRKRWDRFKRLLRYKLLVPLKRSRHPPEYTARGVAVGLAWAFTPSVGVQMACVLIHWIVSRKYFDRDFSIVSAMAWTWITNVFTVVPVYYSFYVTGQILLGHGDITGYDSFRQLVAVLVDDSISARQVLEIVVAEWFLTMLIGCIPFAIGGWYFGWFFTLRTVTAYRHARAVRVAERAARRRGSAAPKKNAVTQIA